MLKSSNESLKLWPYEFELTLQITIADTLSLSLKTKNCDTKDFYISQAFHSYFAISDISKVYVDGLDEKSYFNKVNNTHGNIQQGKLGFNDETDSVYQSIDGVLTIVDKNQSIAIEFEQPGSAIVWNPGEKLTQKMADLSDYKTMLCVESGNVLEDERLVEVGDTFTLKMKIGQKNH